MAIRLFARPSQGFMRLYDTQHFETLFQLWDYLVRQADTRNVVLTAEIFVRDADIPLAPSIHIMDWRSDYRTLFRLLEEKLPCVVLSRERADAMLAAFRADHAAWEDFRRQPPDGDPPTRSLEEIEQDYVPQKLSPNSAIAFLSFYSRKCGQLMAVIDWLEKDYKDATSPGGVLFNKHIQSMEERFQKAREIIKEIEEKHG